MKNLSSLAILGIGFLSTLSLGAQISGNTAVELKKSTLLNQTVCGNMVAFDSQNLFMGNGYYRYGVEEPRKPIAGSIFMVPLGTSQGTILHTQDGPLGIYTQNNQAYVLTYTGIELWDLKTQQRLTTYATQDQSTQPLAYMQHAQAMAQYKNKLVIAHGRLGLTVFNMDQKRLTTEIALIPQQFPMESMATGVTIQGHLAYVLMDSFTLSNPDQVPAFRGIVIFDMESERVVAELNGLDPGADAITSDGKNLIISFGGIPIWPYDLSSFANAKKTMPEPITRLSDFPIQGHPTGLAALDDTYYYTCYSQAPAAGQGNLYKDVPQVLERSLLHLK